MLLLHLNKFYILDNILYKNQHKLNQKPIYDSEDFKIILEITDKDLIRFFDELYIKTNSNTLINLFRILIKLLYIFVLFVNFTLFK